MALLMSHDTDKHGNRELLTFSFKKFIEPMTLQRSGEMQLLMHSIRQQNGMRESVAALAMHFETGYGNIQFSNLDLASRCDYVGHARLSTL